MLIQNTLAGNSFKTHADVNDGRWHHIAYVYDASATGFIALYVDGKRDNSQRNTYAWIWPESQPLSLGQSADTAWKAFNGSMDDFRVYNRTLTDSEIAQIAAGDDASVVGANALVERLNFDGPPSGFFVEWTYGQLMKSQGDAGGPYQAVPEALAPWLISSEAPTQFFRAVAK